MGKKVTVELSLDDLRQLCKEMFETGQNDGQLSNNERWNEMTEYEEMNMINCSIFMLFLEDKLLLKKEGDYVR